MARPFLYALTVVTSPPTDDAVGELLRRLTGSDPCSYTEEASGRCRVTVYLRRLPHRKDRLLNLVREGLRTLGRAGLDVRGSKIRLDRLPQEDWAESWKHHFKPIQIAGRLLVRTCWHQIQPLPAQVEVILDPGLSFGTGHHPTTAFCLDQIVRCLPQTEDSSLLDIGSGSGILAIAAAKLGCRRTEAFDSDPIAVRVSRANAKRNRVANQIRFRRQDLGKAALPNGSFNVVCANLTADLLIQHAPVISRPLRRDGVLLLAGMLTPQFPAVRNRFQQLGFRLKTKQTEGEWTSGAFRTTS